MKRTHVELTDEQREQLHRVARRKGRSLPDVIHEAVDLFLSEVCPEDPNQGGGEGSEPERRVERSKGDA